MYQYPGLEKCRTINFSAPALRPLPPVSLQGLPLPCCHPVCHSSRQSLLRGRQSSHVHDSLIPGSLQLLTAQPFSCSNSSYRLLICIHASACTRMCGNLSLQGRTATSFPQVTAVLRRAEGPHCYWGHIPGQWALRELRTNE